MEAPLWRPIDGILDGSSSASQPAQRKRIASVPGASEKKESSGGYKLLYIEFTRKEQTSLPARVLKGEHRNS